MDQCKSYSRFMQFSRSKSKQKSPEKSKDKSIPRKRSVTFSSDVDLIKSISCQENLLDLIGRVQKQRLDYIQSLQTSQSTTTPLLLIEQENNKTSKQLHRKVINRETIDFALHTDANQKPKYQKQTIYGKYIEPTQYKKIDYQSIKTFESALSLHVMEELHKQQKGTTSSQELVHVQTPQQKLVDEINKFDQLLQQNYNQDCDLYQEQSKINRIIDDALKVKQQKRDPKNASKSLKQQKAFMRSYLQNQYKNALSTAMQGIQLDNDDSIFVRKKSPKKPIKKTSNSFIANQYTTKAIRSQSIHPERKEFVNKAMDIYDKCYSYLK